MKESKDYLIESALKKESSFQLPDHFSENVIRKILAKVRRERRMEIFAIITVGLLFLIAFIITLYLTEFKFSLGALTFLSNHIGLISFAILFIGFLHLIDKKLVRRQQVN